MTAISAKPLLLALLLGSAGCTWDQKTANTASVAVPAKWNLEGIEVSRSSSAGRAKRPLAFIIANSDYSGSRLKDLPQCKQDARTLEYYLSTYAGFEVKTYHDVEYADSFRKLVYPGGDKPSELASLAAGRPFVFVYYSGHGIAPTVKGSLRKDFLVPTKVPLQGDSNTLSDEILNQCVGTDAFVSSVLLSCHPQQEVVVHVNACREAVGASQGYETTINQPDGEELPDFEVVYSTLSGYRSFAGNSASEATPYGKLLAQLIADKRHLLAQRFPGLQSKWKLRGLHLPPSENRFHADLVHVDMSKTIPYLSPQKLEKRGRGEDIVYRSDGLTKAQFRSWRQTESHNQENIPRRIQRVTESLRVIQPGFTHLPPDVALKSYKYLPRLSCSMLDMILERLERDFLPAAENASAPPTVLDATYVSGLFDELQSHRGCELFANLSYDEFVTACDLVLPGVKDVAQAKAPGDPVVTSGQSVVATPQPAVDPGA